MIKKGDIQIMSAGTGVTHSEYNKNKDKPVKFLQIWIFPKEKDTKPRYDQITLDEKDLHNNFQQIVSPNADDAGVCILQDSWFHLGKFDKDFSLDYSIKKSGNGVYAFILKGDVVIDGNSLNERDGLGIWNTDQFSVKAISQDAEILLMEVPMSM